MTYQAIESGNILDALTDLTGATCEFYTPDVNPPENLFLILHRSCVNRSMMVCWRNDKRLTPTGFYSYQKDVEELEHSVTQEEGRALHIVTATAKFPTKDGRILEMVRLKSPFPSEPKWFGKFSNGDSNSWDSLKSYFPMEFKPLANKEKDEYWLTLEDFHCNFGGLIIISSTQPFHKEGINIERHYEDDMDLMIKTPPISEVNNSNPFSAANNKRRLCNLKDDKQDFGKGNIEIAVLEGEKTVKTDTVNTSARKNSGENTKAISFKNFSDKDEIDSILDNRMRVTTLQHIINKRRYTDGSIFSVCSQTQSMFSTSDISVHLSSDSKQEVQKTRPVSASGRLRSRFESQAGCLSSLRQCNFLATKIDHFRTLGSWRSVLEYKGQWTSTDTVSCTTFSGNNIDVMDKYPRIALTILGTDCDDNTLTSSNLQITSHVLISLIQGYTHTSRATSSLYGRIGFTIFKCDKLRGDNLRGNPASHITYIKWLSQESLMFSFPAIHCMIALMQWWN